MDRNRVYESSPVYQEKAFDKEARGDLNQADEYIQDGKGISELYEQTLRRIREGKVVEGVIVQVDEVHVLVDIGYKSEGQIPAAEFIDSEGNQTAEVGDKIDVLLERKENKDGLVILSKEKAAKIKIWDEVEEVYKKNRTVRGKIISRVKGGYCVDIGLRAFLPGSQVDLRPIRDVDALIGPVHDFRVLKCNKHRRNVVVSRRAVLEAEQRAIREKILQRLEKGAVFAGTVESVTSYGLFVDIGGVVGLAHKTDMSWGRVWHPLEMHRIGDKITVKVLNIDIERERVSLGIKQLTPDPWTRVEDEYALGAMLKGRVVGIRDYGAFVELKPGIEGMLHVSEMSWSRTIRHPSQVLNVGDTVNVMVLYIDAAKKRISLGMKHLEPNPWDTIAEKYPVGTTIQGKIKHITSFGLFIGIDDGIDGLVHISDISWTKRIKHPSELYKTGQEVQAVVLNIDREDKRFSLGIKQVTPDPWDEVPKKYPRGTRVTGTVTNVTNFGVFVELEEGIEGLIHLSELPMDEGTNPMLQFHIDDVVECKVIEVIRQDNKIRLSTRKLEESKEHPNVFRTGL